jgi:hypothetical protein
MWQSAGARGKSVSVEVVIVVHTKGDTGGINEKSIHERGYFFERNRNAFLSRRRGFEHGSNRWTRQ